MIISADVTLETNDAVLAGAIEGWSTPDAEPVMCDEDGIALSEYANYQEINACDFVAYALGLKASDREMFWTEIVDACPELFDGSPYMHPLPQGAYYLIRDMGVSCVG